MLQVQETSPSAKDTQSHLLKVRQLIAPEMVANEPDQDQTEVFLAAAERGESTKVRKVRQHKQAWLSLVDMSGAFVCGSAVIGMKIC